MYLNILKAKTMNYSYQPWKEEFEEVDILEEKFHNLIIWNDNVNTFDWVIAALIEICGHTEEQAEQCTMFIHFKGKYSVKKGDYNTLKPMCESLLDRSINATIDY